jgi:hypothetical protein
MHVPILDGFGGALQFCCTYPGCPSLLLFAQPRSNTLFSLEFTDGQVDVSHFPVRSQFTWLNWNQAIYGWASTKTELFIVASDGSLRNAVPSECDVEGDDLMEYRVPLTFWVNCELATEANSHITGTDPSQNYNTLYRNNAAFFHTGIGHKVLTFHVHDPTYAIVGISLFFGKHGSRHRPDFVKLNGRSYNTKADRIYMLPLMPNEVKPGQDVDLVFPRRIDDDIVLQRASIFIVKFRQILPFVQLKSSIQEEQITMRSLTEIAAFQIVSTLNVVQGDEFDKDVLVKLVGVMYSNRKFSTLARAAVARIITVRPEIVQIWAEAVSEMLVRGEVDTELWPALWSDLEVFGASHEERLQELIWNSSPGIGSIPSMLAAFTS